MKLNLFFVSIATFLIMIYIGFEPLDIKKQKLTDIPMLEITLFTIRELDETGLTTLMSGDSANRYKDRYDVVNINYTDNSKEYIANFTANNGVYEDQEDIINLKGDVIYNREDGLNFKTDSVHYNQKTSIATTNTDYVMYRNLDKITGTSLVYDNRLNKIKSKNVVITYKLKERKK